jgi:negative regulator of sigma E activity
MLRFGSIPCRASIFMNSRHWVLLAVAVASAASATLAAITTVRRRHQRKTALLREGGSDLHSWESEGGSLSPTQASATSP